MELEQESNDNGRVDNKKFLTYDDVQIRPKYSNIKSRSDCDTSTKISENIEIQAPVVGSPMDTVTEEDMAFELWRLGGIGFIHRFDTIEDQVNRVGEVERKIEDYFKSSDIDPSDKSVHIAAAIGATGDYLDRAEALINAGVDVLLIDVAHGHHTYLQSALIEFNMKWPDVDVVAGTIATKEAAASLLSWGASSLRVGLGNGCFTPDMKVNTMRGSIPISEIEVGDVVRTHTGNWKEVVDTFEYQEDDEVMVVNDEIECTPDHEFYVVHEKYTDIVNEKNVHQYAEWVEAKDLTDEYYMVEYE